jgi:hypothetical protein
MLAAMAEPESAVVSRRAARVVALLLTKLLVIGLELRVRA